MSYETWGLAPGLEELVAVARHEHITRAAQQLGIPQPTLSRSLARLSDDLGIALLRREGRGVRLTRHGRLLAEQAERSLEQLLVGIRAVRAEADPDSGTIVLGFLHSLGPIVVPALLRTFRITHPGVHVELIQDASEDILAGVLSGRVDLGLASPVPANHPQLKSRRLADQPLILLVPADHGLARRRRVKLSDLAGEQLITMTPGTGVRATTDHLLRGAGVAQVYSYETQEMTTAAGLVAAGLGIAILPIGTATTGTVEVGLRDPGTTRTISLAWSDDRQVANPVAHLRRHIIDQAPALLVRAAATA
jgi:LysR family transcriptional activator of glutamate synthase operon